MDRETYRKFYKLPKPRDKEAIKTLNINKLSLNNSNYRIDYRPKTFLKIMKFEMIILLISVSSILGNMKINIALKYFSKSLQHKGPQEKLINKHELTDVQKEIEKTLRQLDQK